jgi:hypothetical protein
MLLPVAVRSKTWVFGVSFTDIVGSNTSGAGCLCGVNCCVLSGSGLCYGPITRPEESYCVCLCVFVFMSAGDQLYTIVA